MNYFKNNIKVFLITLTIVFSNIETSYSQSSPANTPATSSQYATVSQKVGITDISISYSRPRVKGRKIWGALVPYGYKSFSLVSGNPDAPWRTGANHNTTISFEHDVKINGEDISAGKYALSMAIFENGEVDIIFNKNTKNWGTFGYESKDDVLKIKVQSEETTNTKEALAFEFINGTTTKVEIALLWENKKIPFNVEVDTQDIVYQGLLSEQNSFKRLSSGGAWAAGAAMYIMNSSTEDKEQLNQGATWMALVIGTKEAPGPGRNSFANMSTYANLLLLQGKSEEAAIALDEAFAMPPAIITAGTMNFYGGQVLKLGFPDVAIRAFKFLETTYPGNEWKAKNGLVKVYATKGEYKTALKHLQAAKKYAPEGYNKEVHDKRIQKLKKMKDGKNNN